MVSLAFFTLPILQANFLRKPPGGGGVGKKNKNLHRHYHFQTPPSSSSTQITSFVGKRLLKTVYYGSDLISTWYALVSIPCNLSTVMRHHGRLAFGTLYFAHDKQPPAPLFYT